MSHKTFGVLSLISAFAVLLWEPGEGIVATVLHLFTFLGLFVAGSLLLMGLIGTPSRVTALRHGDAEQTRDALPTPPTTTDSFPRPRPGMAISTLFIILSLLPLGLAGWVIWAGPWLWFENLLISLPLLLTGIGCPLYYHCHYRSRWLTTPTSLILETCRPRQELQWSDIKLITTTDVRTTSYMSAGLIHTIYGARGKIRILGRVERLDTLLSTIAQATGLSWKRPGRSDSSAEAGGSR